MYVPVIAVDLILILIGVASALVIAEFSLRVFFTGAPQLFRLDYFAGWTNRPNAIGMYRREGRSEVRINSDGLRDREHSKIKPLGKFRIAILGDSLTEALEVPIEANFSSVTERALQQCMTPMGMRPEVLNFGVVGYGTLQELITLGRKVWAYSPDMVVLALFPGNDVSDNFAALNAPGWPRPYASLKDGQLQIDNSFRESLRTDRRDLDDPLREPLFYRLRLFQLFVAPAIIRWNTAKEGGSQLFGQSASGDLQPPQTESWRQAWTVTEKLLEEMNREIVAHKARFVVMIVSDPDQVYPVPAYRDQLQDRLGVKDLFYPNHRLEALGKRAGFAVVSLGEPFQHYADQNHIFLHGFSNFRIGFGHLNEAGHRLAGETLATRVCEVLGERH